MKLPDQPGLWVIDNYLCVQKAALAALRHRDDETGRVLHAILDAPGLERGRPFGLFNRDDFVLLGGEELAQVADEIIGQAEQDCKNMG